MLNDNNKEESKKFIFAFSSSETLSRNKKIKPIEINEKLKDAVYKRRPQSKLSNIKWTSNFIRIYSTLRSTLSAINNLTPYSEILMVIQAINIDEIIETTDQLTITSLKNKLFLLICILEERKDKYPEDMQLLVNAIQTWCLKQAEKFGFSLQESEYTPNELVPNEYETIKRKYILANWPKI